MISRVYSAMGRAEPAIYHAKRCLEITQETGIGDWDLGFAYEALTRAYAIAGDRGQYKKYLRMAKEAIASTKKEEDRGTVQSELDKVVYKTA
jgi:hypothetical protein